MGVGGKVNVRRLAPRLMHARRRAAKLQRQVNGNEALIEMHDRADLTNALDNMAGKKIHGVVRTEFRRRRQPWKTIRWLD